jgi:hypothetical protein
MHKNSTGCLTFGIVVKSKVDTPVAEVTLSVKQNDRTVILFKSQGGHFLPIPANTHW